MAAARHPAARGPRDRGGGGDHRLPPPTHLRGRGSPAGGRRGGRRGRGGANGARGSSANGRAGPAPPLRARAPVGGLLSASSGAAAAGPGRPGGALPAAGSGERGAARARGYTDTQTGSLARSGAKETMRRALRPAAACKTCPARRRDAAGGGAPGAGLGDGGRPGPGPPGLRPGGDEAPGGLRGRGPGARGAEGPRAGGGAEGTPAGREPRQWV